VIYLTENQNQNRIVIVLKHGSTHLKALLNAK